MLRKAKPVLAGIGAAVAGVLVFGTPAAAHVKVATVYSAGGTELGHAAVQYSHTHMIACDDEHDSVGVYGRFKLDNGQIIDIADMNGASSGCGEADTPPGRYVVSLEAVWRNGRSSGWQTA